MNIPALRFHEFKGAWESKSLGELLEFKNGINASKEQYGQGVKFINVLDILNNDFITYNKIIGNVNVDPETVSKYPVTFGDILFQRSSETREEVGSASVYLDKENTATFGGFVIRGRKVGEYDPVFLNKLLKTDIARNDITSKSGGSTRYNVGQEILSNVSLPFPTLPEQTKIANFLTAVDDRLNQLKQKKFLLEQYKKGVMQKIFDQKIRFKDDDGNEFPAWEMKTLAELGETYSGLSGKTKDDFGQGKPYIQYKQIFDNSKIDISRFEYVNVGETEKQNKVFFGDIFFTVSSETPDEIGTSSVLLDKVDELYLNSFCFGYRPNSLDVFSPYFAQYLFRSDLFRTEIVKLAQGSTRYNMSKVQLMKLIVNLPCLVEQTKIANFLSAIDEKISLCNNQIAKSEQYKKGLLQQMFV